MKEFQTSLFCGQAYLKIGRDPYNFLEECGLMYKVFIISQTMSKQTFSNT